MQNQVWCNIFYLFILPVFAYLHHNFSEILHTVEIFFFIAWIIVSWDSLVGLIIYDDEKKGFFQEILMIQNQVSV